MFEAAPIGSKPRHTVLRAVILPSLAMLLVLAIAVASVLHFSSSRSDSLALDRQKHLVRISVTQAIGAIAHDQEASTHWDDAVTQVQASPIDFDWVDNNLGIWFNAYYRHDEVYLLNQRNRAVYAMQRGIRTAPSSFATRSSRALPLVRALRTKLVAGALVPGDPGGRTIGAVEVALVAGRPAIISLKPIVTETDKVSQRPGSEFIHVSLRYLDGPFLAEMGKTYGIDDLRFTARPRDASALAVRGSDGTVLGFVGWSAFPPGEQIKRQLQPVLLLALLLLAAVIAFLQLRVARSRNDLEASRARAQHQAYHDSLTGLANRSFFEERLDQILSGTDQQPAVLLLDLDRFKNVNDTLGHQAGDALIRQFAERVAGMTRNADLISRFGGDEFAILVEHATLQEMHRFATRILADVARSFDIVGNQIHIGASIGIAIDLDGRGNRLELVRQADIALYRAKDMGRNTYCLFQPHMDEAVKLRSAIEDELRETLATKHGLMVHYQPQVSCSGAIVGLEALVRWDHPRRRSIAPDQFVPVAEDTGLIVPLGEWVLEQAFATSAIWPKVFVAVNLSPFQVRQSGFIDTVMRLLDATGADPCAIQLEVTERVLLDHNDAVTDTLKKLRSMGFKIALDDFGTGFSSLSYLCKFKVDKIKIDQSFVHQLGATAEAAVVVTAVLALGRAMHLDVAAEGVETAAQRHFLESAGCQEMQGYYFSPPLPRADLDTLLKEGLRLSAAAA